MNNWDNIYKEYAKGGPAWATLSEGVLPQFLTLIGQQPFATKHALDIGCGTGKYLAILKDHGFVTDGIDASGEAVGLTIKLLHDHSWVKQEEMFHFPIPPQVYDLIFSISTLQHGFKEEILEVLDRIYVALIPGGWVCITLPDFDYAQQMNNFQDQHKLVEGTYTPLEGPEHGLPHSFFTETEVKNIFSVYQRLSIELDSIGRWIIIGQKELS